MKIALALFFAIAASAQQEELSVQLLTIKRVYVDKLTGGETAAQMRELLIASLQSAKLFVLTENQERAEGVNMRGSVGGGSGSSSSSRYNSASSGISERSSRSLSLGVGEHESSNIKERKHEALATVRLINKDGDVIWSTTQESTGAKFRGASADVADRITRQLVADYELARRAK
jgi:hypothetical protein